MAETLYCHSVADMRAYAQVMRKRRRQHWRQVGLFPLIVTAETTIIFAVLTSFLFQVTHRELDRATALVSLAAGCVIGLALSPVLLDRHYDPKPIALRGKEWDCELTDDAYVTRVPGGHTAILPWARLKTITETPDAWCLDCAGTALVVFRGSLRKAGMEEELRRRLGAAPTN